MELLKLLSASEIVAQIIAFLFLFFILRKFLWGKMLKFLDDRKAKIADQMQQMENTKNEIEKLKNDYAQRMSSVDQLANQRISEAVAEGRKLTDEIKRKAHQEAQDILNEAQKNVQYELTRAKEELKERVIDLTLQATERIIEDKITEKEDRNLIKSFFDKVEKL